MRSILLSDFARFNFSFIRTILFSDLARFIIVAGPYDGTFKLFECRLPKENFCIGGVGNDADLSVSYGDGDTALYGGDTSQ